MKNWKDIPGFEGLYKASTEGEICSIERTVFNGVAYHILRGRTLKPIPNGTGYFAVCLRKENKTFRLYIHRLVAMTFIENDNYNLEVNHIDGNKENNRLENLEWVTRSANQNHKYKVLKHSGANKGKTGILNWRSKPVNMINQNNEIVKTFPAVMEAARQLNIDNASIRSVIYGKSKTCCGYKWEYVK